MQIDIPPSTVSKFCQHYHVQWLALFGSVLREDFRADSDIDVLVEFEPEHIPGFFRFVQMQDELSGLLGRAVDLNTPLSLSRHFRQTVLQSAQVIYERTG